MDERPSWDEYFMGLARTVATRSTCPRASVGAIIVLDKRVIGTGYNGSPSGTPHCTDAGCYMVADHCIRTIHAEVNALFDALQRGSVRGATVYCTHHPCVQCMKLMKQAGIAEIVYGRDYNVPTDERDLWDSLDIQTRLI